MADAGASDTSRHAPAGVVLADLTEQTYRLLRDRILRREMKAGAKISVDAIADRLGVSRTPVTDALKRLAADGLVEIASRRGTFVSGISSRDAAEMFDIRSMIELHATDAALASGRGPVALSGMQAPFQGMNDANAGDRYQDYEAFIDQDRLFHRAIVAALGNRQLLRLYDGINVHMYVARAHFVTSVEPARVAQTEHRAIRAAFLAGDAAVARDALAAHITGVRDRVVEIIDRHGGLI
jgi:DNA-binding GntR family transcriptional regulator